MSRLKFFIPALCFIALGGLLWRGLYLDTRPLPSMLIDKQMPKFTLETIGGDIVTNEDLPEQIFLLNVWGSYCLPCLVEHPTFMRLSEEGEIPVVGINYKVRNALAKGWLETNGNPFAYSIEDENGRFGIDLGVYGAPETFLLDDQGDVIYKRVGDINPRIWRDELAPRFRQLGIAMTMGNTDAGANE